MTPILQNSAEYYNRSQPSGDRNVSLHQNRSCLGSPLNRRMFMHVGFAGGLGLTLDQMLRLQSAHAADSPAAKKGPKAEALIHIYLPGGSAHQESWDPKPYSPVEYRGDMASEAATPSP